MPKYEFDVFDVIYLGEGKVRIKAKVNDKKLKKELEGKAMPGVKLPSERPLWKVELRTKKELVVEKKKHNCPRKYYRVLVRKGNYSTFIEPKGEFHESEWSLLVCLRCRHQWRTKAKYVDKIPDIRPEDGWEGTIGEALNLYTVEVKK